MEKNDVLKNKLLEMAVVFHNFCQENGIAYYMLGGTMLGTVRHKGFIPWDDDMDFGMMREDYDRFVSLKYKFPQGFSVNTHDGNKDYEYGFCKIYDESTTYIEQGYNDKHIGGVYIDIFPIDSAGDDYSNALKMANKIYKKSFVLSCIYHKGKRKTFLKDVAAKMFGLLPKGPKWFDWLYDTVKKFKGKQTKYVLNVYGAHVAKEVVPRDFFGKPTLYDFENTQFYGVEKSDEYLKSLYGDYMTPPPEDKRGGHNIVYVDFNTPYKEYKKTNGE